MRIPTHKPPTHPGEMLLEEFLKPMDITPEKLGDSIHVSTEMVNDIINQQTGITPSLALRLAKFLGTSPEMWINLQLCWDFYHILREEKDELDAISPIGIADLQFK